MNSWQLQKAKAQLSALVRCAKDEGPQEISVRGKPSVVVLSQEDYLRLTKPRPGLVEFLRKSPLAGLDLDLTRDPSPDRDISF